MKCQSELCEVCGKLLYNDSSSIILLNGYNGDKYPLCSDCKTEIMEYVNKMMTRKQSNKMCENKEA